jgi:hypothetical protein
MQQYGEAYLLSIFVTDPAKAFHMAQMQLRAKASTDLTRFCLDNKQSAVAAIEIACGARVPGDDHQLAALNDEQVGLLWAHVDPLRPSHSGSKMFQEITPSA